MCVKEEGATVGAKKEGGFFFSGLKKQKQKNRKRKEESWRFSSKKREKGKRVVFVFVSTLESREFYWFLVTKKGKERELPFGVVFLFHF